MILTSCEQRRITSGRRESERERARERERERESERERERETDRQTDREDRNKRETLFADGYKENSRRK